MKEWPSAIWASILMVEITGPSQAHIDDPELPRVHLESTTHFSSSPTCPNGPLLAAATKDPLVTANMPSSPHPKMLETCEPSVFASDILFTKFDRFLHLAFRGPKQAFHQERVKIAWSVIRQRHPLLMCKVLVDGGDLTTARFSSVFTAFVACLHEG
jgi:hypothetical protein